MTREAGVRAYAKLNLGLRVLHRRPDGYHELRTIFQTISLADRLQIAFKRARSTRISVQGTPHIQDNLVEKAALLVMEALGIDAEIRFDLQKNIPAGAGLGGGSSDAAAVLLTLPVLAGKALAPDRLFSIAGGLGSDVPFFLHGGTAVGLGRGEELYPLADGASVRGLLVVSGVHSSSAEAYRDLSPRLTSIGLQNKLFDFQRSVWANGVKGDDPAMARNDFEEVVFERHPDLKETKERLTHLGARPASMTGSGSAIFGLFADVKQLNQARKSFPDKTVFPISFVSRARYRSAWRRALRNHAEGTLWPPQSPSARSQYVR